MAKNTDLLDMTDWKPNYAMDYQGQKDKLIEDILYAVHDTQSLVIQPLPNILLLTRYQFNLLRPDETYDPEEALIWRVWDPKVREVICMMDIHVKGEFEPKPKTLLTLT